ncbi:MAG: hypothetical protein WCL28_01615 [bacterium]
MRSPLITMLIILAPILTNCAAKEDSSTVKSISNSDGIATIGRGTKMIMLKDLEIPANKSQVEIGPVVSSAYIEGESNMILNTYMVCGIQLAETSLDRRVLKSGIALEFTGEASSYPNDENSNVNVEDLTIKSPSAFTSFGCVKLVRKCFESLCDPYRQSPFKIQDLESVLKGVAKIERAAPVPIPSNLH